MQRTLTLYAWCTSIAIPLGIGIMATCHQAIETLWFVVMAMLLGVALFGLRATGRWARKPCLAVTLAFELASLVIAYVLSLAMLPLALLVAAAIFLFGLDRWWTVAAESAASLQGALSPRPSTEGSSWSMRSWRRVLRFAVLALTLLAPLQIARFSLHMMDGSLTLGWPVPLTKADSDHECLVVYLHAAALNREGVSDLYTPAWYKAHADARGNSNAQAAPILEGSEGLLNDIWLYPPQALLLPQLGVALTNSYPMLRTGWFVLQSVLSVVLLLLIVRGLGPSSLAFVLLPLLWWTQPFITNLQFGQPHFLVLCAAAYAILLFDRGRNLSGGFLLAWAISVKIFPAFLGVYLLFRRQYRAAAMTIVGSLVIVLISLPIVGLVPYRAFLFDQLPRMLGGGAWDRFLTGDLFGTGQYTFYGILLSLYPGAGKGILGVVAPIAMKLHTPFLIGVIWVAAKRHGVLSGLAIANLAAMAGYYAPPEYTAVGVTTLVLLAAGWGQHRLASVLVALPLWGLLGLLAKPSALPVIWRSPLLSEVAFVLGFAAAMVVNVYLAAQRAPKTLPKVEPIEAGLR